MRRGFDSIAAQPRIITWRVAGDLISRIEEGTGISKKAFAIHHLFDAETAAGITGDIGPLATVSHARIGQLNVERLPGLPGQDAVELPATHHAIRPAVHVFAEALAPADRQFVTGTEDEAVRRIPGGDRPLAPYVPRILRAPAVGRACVTQPGIGPRTVVEDPGKRVAAEEIQTIRVTLLQTNLQRVVPGVALRVPGGGPVSETSIELRIRPQEIDLRKRRAVVGGSRNI